MVTIRRLTSTASEAEIEAAADTLADAFVDPVTRAAFGDDRALRHRHLRAGVITSASDMEVHVVDGDGGTMDAVMLVKPPGVISGQTPNSKGPHREGLDDNEHYTRVMTKLKEVFKQLELEACGPDGFNDTYYLDHIGIASTMQGKGLGKACLQFLTDRAARQGKRVTLFTMTPELERYYTRYGFRTLATRDYDLEGLPMTWYAMATDAGTATTEN